MGDVATALYALMGFIIIASIIAIEARDLLSTVISVAAAGAGLAIVFLLGRISGSTLPGSVVSEAMPGGGFAAVPGTKGGQEFTGPYDVVPDWPRPLSDLRGHAGWAWGAVQGIFAEGPDRVLILQRGELPVIEQPEARPLPEFGPSLSFPVGEAPHGDAQRGLAAGRKAGLAQQHRLLVADAVRQRGHVYETAAQGQERQQSESDGNEGNTLSFGHDGTPLFVVRGA